jgi:hypothetical protein
LLKHVDCTITPAAFPGYKEGADMGDGKRQMMEHVSAEKAVVVEGCGNRRLW